MANSLSLYIRGQKTLPFRARMKNGRSVFRSKRPRAKARGALLLILALAAFLRLFRLGYQSLWIDEINAVTLSGKSLFKILFTGDTTPPFIYLVSHFWQKLGNSDFMVRVPSVVFGVISIYAVYKLTKALLGIKEALFASFLMSISLYHIMYSQEAARPYMAFTLFSLLSLYCLYQMLNSNLGRYWAGFIIFNTLNLYTQLFAIFVLAAELIIWLVFTTKETLKKGPDAGLRLKKIIKFFLTVLSILIFSLPVALSFLSATRQELAGGRAGWSLIYYKNLLCRYGAGNGLPFFIYNFFFVSGAFSLFKGSRRKEVFLLIFCLIFPFFILNFMELKHFFHIRYVIFTYPIYIIIVSKGVTNILDFKPKFSNKIAYGFIIIFLILSIIPLKHYYLMPARLTDWRGAANYIYDNAGNRAKVITQEWHDNLIKYYLAKRPEIKDIKVIPHHNDINYLVRLLLNNVNQEIYCVAYGEDIGYGTDEFSLFAEKYFKDKVVFYSPVYSELIKRELIDADANSWVDVGVRGYRLVVYFNQNK